MGTNILEEIDCGNLFDQIEDLMDFPLDDNECGGDAKLVSSIDSQSFPSWNDALSDSNPFLSTGHINSVSDLSAELSVPCEDILQLEWLSTFVEDSFSSVGLTIGKDNHSYAKVEPTVNHFQISSPLSVLESTTTSSSSSSGGKTMPPLGPQRARSKRPRPATFNPRPMIKLLSPSSSDTTNNPFIRFPLELDSFVESSPIKKKNQNKPRKNKTGEEGCKIKIKKTKVAWSIDQSAPARDEGPVRKCLHCQITKTPQWRGGPLGPKTLCNACGVRYKSGRLFPEYRPAASPTFVPSLHSNSHKKVVEMRSKVEPGDAMKVEEGEVVPSA